MTTTQLWVKVIRTDIYRWWAQSPILHVEMDVDQEDEPDVPGMAMQLTYICPENREETGSTRLP